MTQRDILASSDPEEPWESMIAEVLEEEGQEVTEAAVNQRLAGVYADARKTVSAAHFDPGAFNDAVVISAEEVAAYWMTLPQGTVLIDMLDVLAPPYERSFVEFQRQPNKREIDLNSWGVLIDADRVDIDSGPEWIVMAQLVWEFRKGEPVGPVATWWIPLDEHGRPIWGEAGLGAMFPQRTVWEGGSPVDEELADPTVEFAASHLGPALFAISLMHCKNVDVKLVDPPERLSRKHERRHGRPLISYYVLDIKPMRRILDSEGDAQTKGLAHALHICRGHFKTYTEDAPLFGKQVGTYWWAAQARGKAEEGVIEKDYRIRLDQGLGREYVHADEHAEIAPDAPEHTGLDPDLGGRGLRAHNITQNLVASAVEEAGYDPRRPKPDEPQYDLAWEAGDVTWVAEVKSITAQNEERQLRQALGQVLRYRQLLEADGRTVRALIAVEREPSDPSWGELCAGEGIALVRPPITLPASPAND
jgi:hypothetical protein